MGWFKPSPPEDVLHVPPPAQPRASLADVIIEGPDGQDWTAADVFEHMQADEASLRAELARMTQAANELREENQLLRIDLGKSGAKRNELRAAIKFVMEMFKHTNNSGSADWWRMCRRALKADPGLPEEKPPRDPDPTVNDPEYPAEGC